MINIRLYPDPDNQELRSFFYEQHSWNWYKGDFIKQNVKIPQIIVKDKRRMQEIEIEDKEAIIKRNELTLPKIIKKAQNTQRIMSH